MIDNVLPTKKQKKWWCFKI